MMNIKANKNLNILLRVCDYTGYEVGFENNEIICTDTCTSNTTVYRYKNIEDALIDWLDTMEEQEEQSNGTWSTEIRYVKRMKKEKDTKKFLYDNLDIGFCGNTTDDGFGLSCEFSLNAPILPMIKVVDLPHYADADYIINGGYVSIEEGRIEVDEETGKIAIWIFEPTMDNGGEFLHKAEVLHYDKMELQNEIIKRWNEEVNGK